MSGATKKQKKWGAAKVEQNRSDLDGAFIFHHRVDPRLFLSCIYNQLFSCGGKRLATIELGSRHATAHICAKKRQCRWRR
jgi:hypothetical protein